MHKTRQVEMNEVAFCLNLKELTFSSFLAFLIKSKFIISQDFLSEADLTHQSPNDALFLSVMLNHILVEANYK